MMRLIFLLTLSLITISACSNSPVDPKPDPGKGDGSSIEPAISINNPTDGVVLEGEITFSVEGEAENGFDEVRIYVGEELIKTTQNPTMPFEHTILTYEHDNGDYDLRAELDVTEQDTTISASVSVTLENYMVILETENYIELLKNRTEATYMFIADPQGNVLHQLELTAHNDGVMKLLPPEELENGAPEHYSLTIGQKFTDPEGRDIFTLSTDVELKPWSRIYRSSTIPMLSSVSKRDLTVEMRNFEQPPLYTAFQMTEYINANSIYYHDVYMGHPDSIFYETIPVPVGPEDLVITTTPDFNSVENPVPVYRWEKNLTELSSPISYNVAEDFTPMVSHDVSYPSYIEMNAYAYFMTVDPNSFDKGDVNFAYWMVRDIGDANGSNPGLGMWVPQITERSFITFFDGYDKNDPNTRYRYQSPVGGFPDEFAPLNAEVEIINPSLDNLQLGMSGSFDYAILTATASGSSYSHRWRVVLPNDADSFVFPKIAEILDPSVTNYNRSSFDFTNLIMTDSGKLDGYDDHLELVYGTTDFGVMVEFNQIIQRLNTSAKQKQKQISAPLKSSEMINRSPYLGTYDAGLSSF